MSCASCATQGDGEPLIRWDSHASSFQQTLPVSHDVFVPFKIHIIGQRWYVLYAPPEFVHISQKNTFDSYFGVLVCDWRNHSRYT